MGLQYETGFRNSQDRLSTFAAHWSAWLCADERPPQTLDRRRRMQKMDRLMRKAARVLMLMAADVLRRVRRRGRSALFRAARMTGATVAAFLIAELVGLRTPPPLIAA
jgi:hypothetical protein